MRLPAVPSVLLILVGVAALPVPANAAVAKFSSIELPSYGRQSGGFSATLLVTDPDGVANDVVVDVVKQADPRTVSFTVTDTAGMRPAEGCSAVDPQTVSCTLAVPDVPSVSVGLQLGAGDDRELVHMPAQVGLRVDGGPGNDTLPGVAGQAGTGIFAFSDFSADGGPGDDVITAFGRRAFVDGGPGSDRIDGGGQARLSYAASPQAVRVDLAAGTGGAAGEHDVLTGIGELVGSAFDDDLRGSDAAESLEGGDGHDVLYGRGGPDRLTGNQGDDLAVGGAGDDAIGMGAGSRTYEHERVEGGPGNDVIQGGRGADTLIGNAGTDTIGEVGLEDVVAARDGSLDRILCTRPRPGAAPRPPRILRVDSEDSVVQDCTGTRRDGPAAGVLSDINDATRGGTRLAVGLACSVDALPQCPMRLVITAGDLGVIARRTVKVPRAGYRRVALTLSRTARAALRCTGRLPVRVTLVTRDTAGRSRTRTLGAIARAGLTGRCTTPRPA